MGAIVAFLAGTACACALGASKPIQSGAATAGTVIGATVPSATSLDASGCVTGTAAMELGTVLAGAVVTTTADCTVQFGSSNDTSRLRVFQGDALGSALFRGSDGVLDPTFNGTGTSTSITGTASRAVELGDGSILVAGTSGGDVRVARFTAAGVLDGSFGSGGSTVLDLGGAADRVGGVGVQSDGRIVVAGNTAPAGTSVIVIARLTTNGALDGSFGSSGLVTYDRTPSYDDPVHALIVQPDDRILVGATARNDGSRYEGLVIRLMPAGGFDGSFGTAGVALTSVGNYDLNSGIALLPGGKILAGGDHYANGGSGLGNYPHVARLTSAGTIDTSYGVNGHATTILAGFDNLSLSVAAAPDGSAYVGGYGGVMKFTPAGALDTAFGSGGIVAGATRATVEADGSVFQSRPAGMIARLDGATGSFSPSLGTTGTIAVPAGFSVSDLVPAHDGGMLVLDQSAFRLARLRPLPIPDYATGSTDFSSAAGGFGACLRSVTGAGITGSWPVDGTCGPTDGAWWRAIPSKSIAGGTIATGGTTATGSVRLRFGLHASTGQRAGRYIAPITFEVVAPAA